MKRRFSTILPEQLGYGCYFRLSYFATTTECCSSSIMLQNPHSRTRNNAGLHLSTPSLDIEGATRICAIHKRRSSALLTSAQASVRRDGDDKVLLRPAGCVDTVLRHHGRLVQLRCPCLKHRRKARGTISVRSKESTYDTSRTCVIRDDKG